MRCCNFWYRANGATFWCSRGRCRPMPPSSRRFTRSAQKFGARIVADQHFKPGTDPREREQNNPALLSADQPRLRRGLRRRRRLRFRPHRALSHGAAAAGGRQHRSRAGRLALDLGAQRRPAGQLAVREEDRRAAHGRPRLGGLDGGQDDRAIGAAHPLAPNSPSSAISSSATRVRRRQGAAGRASGRGTIRCARRCCWRRPIRWSPAPRSRAFCTASTNSTRSATTSPKRPAI